METENATTAVKIKMCVGMTAVSFIKSTTSDTFGQMQFRTGLIIPMATLQKQHKQKNEAWVVVMMQS